MVLRELDTVIGTIESCFPRAMTHSDSSNIVTSFGYLDCFSMRIIWSICGSNKRYPAVLSGHVYKSGPFGRNKREYFGSVCPTSFDKISPACMVYAAI